MFPIFTKCHAWNLIIKWLPASHQLLHWTLFKKTLRGVFLFLWIVLIISQFPHTLLIDGSHHYCAWMELGIHKLDATPFRPCHLGKDRKYHVMTSVEFITTLQAKNFINNQMKKIGVSTLSYISLSSVQMIWRDWHPFSLHMIWFQNARRSMVTSLYWTKKLVPGTYFALLPKLQLPKVVPLMVSRFILIFF